MSRRKRRTSRPVETAGELKKRRISPTPIIMVLILAGIPFALGKYIEFNSPGPFDSAAYVYSAKHILDGARMGIEEKTTAQPATLLMNVIGVTMFGFNEVGPKLIQMILQGTALILMFYTMRKVFGNIAGVLSTTVASIYLSAPVIAKFGNVKEQYMIAFMVIAACGFIFYQTNGKWFMAVLTGAAAVNVCYFKETGMSVLAAMGLFMIAQPLMKRSTWLQTAKDFGFIAAGGVLGFIPMAVFYYSQGQFGVLFGTFPVFVARLTAIAAVVIALLALLINLWMRKGCWARLKQINPRMWIAGAVLILIVITPFMIYFMRTGDAGSYLKDIVFVKAALKVKLKIQMAIDEFQQRTGGYVGGSRGVFGFSSQAPIVMRYYGVLILPVALATAGLITGLFRWLGTVIKKSPRAKGPDRFVLFLAVWWILDMAFVWVSPRSYEQYYLPLNASAAMLGAYAAWAYSEKLSAAANKMPWLIGGVVAILIMTAMAREIFFGLSHSPFSGQKYQKPTRGYSQRLAEVRQRRRQKTLSPWETAGDYIRSHSTEDDTIYVWGWVPGIYVRSQRLCPIPSAFESNMHVTFPRVLKRQVDSMVKGFEKSPPKFIVDSRKLHFPWGKTLPLELWPRLPKGFLGVKKGTFLPTDEKSIAQYDMVWKKILTDRSGEDETKRYDAMAPFRKYVRENYKIVGMYGQHVLFERKAAPASR